MEKLLKILFLLFLLFSIITTAQSKGTKTNLFMGGMLVELGMEKGKVIKYYTDNYKVINVPPSDNYETIIIEDKNTEASIGSVGFKNNKVVDIWKTWHETSINNEGLLMTQIYTMLKNIIDKDGFVENEIVLYETNEPKYKSKTIKIVITDHWHINIDIQNESITIKEALVE